MNPFRALFLSLSRMPPVLMLFVILGLAVVVTMYVMGIINDKQSQLARQLAADQAEKGKTIRVVYATKNIDEGEVIPQEALDEKSVEVGRAPVDAYNSINAVVGQQAAYAVPAGTLISTHAIKPMLATPGFEGKIRDGMRALTFGVDTNSGVAGFIAPGSRVDVLAITGAAESIKAAPVMSDVEVIAVGTTYQKAPGTTTANPAGSVTVVTDPEGAVKLVRAASAAKLYLTLRNDKDHTPVAVVDVKDLFPRHTANAEMIAALPESILPPPKTDVTAPEPLKAPAITTPLPPALHEIEIWSGSRKEVLEVPSG